MGANGIEFSKLVGMVFDGAATFSGRMNGIPRLLPSLLKRFLHSNSLYNMATLHYLPKRMEKLKGIQRVIALPELKVIYPAGICWLSRECVYKS